ncbi:MAG TPA: SusC/RagA family TonB-linked outer membrane protein, partial [Chitinophaga sp.]
PSAALANENLVGSIPLDKYRYTNDNASVRTFAEATLLKGLKFKTSYNLDYSSNNSLTYYNSQYGDFASIGGLVDKSSNRAVSYTWNNILTYDHDFNGGHHLNLLGCHEYYSYNITNLSGERQNFSYPGFYEPVAASVLNSFTGQSDVYNKLSFFGQGQYNYLNKYYFTASLRSDASSRFSPAERWGTFYSVGASWHMAEESFLKNVSWINALTPKVSYGASGNDNLSDYYAYQALYSITPNQGTGGATTLRLATPGLKWESNISANAGLDFAFLKNRISGTFSFYNRKSKDLLFPRPLTPSTGFTTIYANVGSLRNTGYELELNVIPVSTKNFRWNLAVNATHNKNVITSLPQSEIISGTKKLMVGKSVYEFYIRDWAGVDPKNGDPLWYMTDADGHKTTTNLYKNASLYYAGSSLPKVYGGVTNTFDYKGIELTFMLSYSLGGKVLDGDYLALMNSGNSYGHTWSKEILNRWTPEHTHTDVPRLSTITQGAWNQASTRFLYSASYARMKYVTLAYNLPKAWMQRANLTNLKVYATGENLLTFYGHKGMDPEQSIDGTTFYQYPTMRTLSVGLQLGF